MSGSGQDEQRQQIFLGPASFGGDNKGIINNHVLLDAKTRDMLAKLSEDAPQLADLLSKALNDGVISPEIADVLMLVVRHITEEIAEDLAFTARNINEDVAIEFKGVAKEFTDVNHELSQRVRELNDVADFLRKMVGQVKNAQGGSAPNDQLEFVSAAEATTRLSPRKADKWRVRFGLMFGSSAAGLVAAMILMRSHLGGQAIFVTVVMVVAAVALFAKARR